MRFVLAILGVSCDNPRLGNSGDGSSDTGLDTEDSAGGENQILCRDVRRTSHGVGPAHIATWEYGLDGLPLRELGRSDEEGATERESVWVWSDSTHALWDVNHEGSYYYGDVLTFSDDHRLLSVVTHEGDGNSTLYDWDDAGRLIGVEQVEHGRRWKWAYDDEGHVISETDTSEGGGEWHTTWTWEDGVVVRAATDTEAHTWTWVWTSDTSASVDSDHFDDGVVDWSYEVEVDDAGRLIAAVASEAGNANCGQFAYGWGGDGRLVQSSYDEHCGEDQGEELVQWDYGCEGTTYYGNRPPHANLVYVGIDAPDKRFDVSMKADL